MDDLFLRLLAPPDSLITSLRKLQPKIGKTLLLEAMALLSYESSRDCDRDTYRNNTGIDNDYSHDSDDNDSSNGD